MESNPQKSIKGATFYPIPEFSGPEIAFGAPLKAFFPRDDLPEVPDKYERMAQELFFKGGSLPEFHKSVDKKRAAGAIHAWLGSWQPAHEAKIATVGYALWLWTDENALDAEAA